MSEVQLDKKKIYIKNKRAEIFKIKGYKDYPYVDVEFSNTDISNPPLWDNIQSLSQSNTLHTAKKAAIYLSKIAAFLLTKTAYFRLLACNKKHSFFTPNIFSNTHTNNKLLFQKLKSLNEGKRRVIFVSFRPDVMDTEIVDKLGLVFLVHSTGCRSPPFVLVSHKKSKRRVFI